MPTYYSLKLTELLLYFAIFSFISFLWLLSCGVLASRKGRGVGRWITAGYCLGLIAVIILVFLPDIRPQNYARPRTAPRAAAAPSGANAIGVARPTPLFPNEGWYCSCGARNDGNRSYCLTCMEKRPLSTGKKK